MKPIFKQSSSILAGIICSTGACFASDDFAENDIAVCFYQVTGSGPGAVVSDNTYIFNLGQGSVYRENTQNNVSVTTVNPAVLNNNIAADLAATFGPDWANGTVNDNGTPLDNSDDINTTVYWCVVGGTSQLPAVNPTNGDPARTIYFSRGRATMNTGATGPDSTIPSISSNNRGTLTLAVTPFLQGNTGYLGGTNAGIYGLNGNTSTSGANVNGVIIPISNQISLDENLPPVANTFFGILPDPRQPLATGTVSGTLGVEGALDIYRILHTTSGADLTAGASPGNATTGIGQYVGTLTLDSTGNLKIQGVGAASGSYSTWATTNGVTGGPNGDSDHDGIPNLTEYALLLNPSGSDGSAGTFNGSTLSFTKRPEAIANGDVSWVIETSTTLDFGSWTPAVTQPAGNTSATVSYLLPPPGPTKNFARLAVKSTP